VLAANRARDVALALTAITAFSIGFERVEPAIGLTADLRLTNLRLALLVTLAVWLLSCVLRRQWPRVPRRLVLPIGLWLAALLLSAVLAPSFQLQALAFVRDITLGVGFGWAVYDLARGAGQRAFVARVLAACGMCVAVVGLGEAANVGPVVEWLAGFHYLSRSRFNVGEISRVTSTLTHPNIAAVLLALVVPLQLAWTVTSRATWSRALLGAGLGAEIVTLVLTVSRTGAAVVEVVLGVMILASITRRQTLVARASLVAVIGLPLVMVLAVARQPILLLHLTSETVQNWYRVDYSTPGTVTAHAGEAAIVPVRLENMGDRVWSASGANPFALSYHLTQPDGTTVTYDGPRTSFPVDVPPGGALDLQAQVVAPQTPGTYLVEWDEVQEHVTWFSWAGSPVAVTYLKVGDAQAANDHAAVIQPTTPPATVVPPPPARLDQWRTALRMVRERPLLGVGPDNFRWVYGDFAGLPSWDTGGHANSVYVEFLADTGLLGLALFLWLAWRLLSTSSRSIVTPHQPLADAVDTQWIWRLAFVASLCAWFLHGLLDYFYEPLPTNLAFWLLAGLALAAAEQTDRRDLDVAACASRSM
jgi:O-antigen ligase